MESVVEETKSLLTGRALLSSTPPAAAAAVESTPTSGSDAIQNAIQVLERVSEVEYYGNAVLTSAYCVLQTLLGQPGSSSQAANSIATSNEAVISFLQGLQRVRKLNPISVRPPKADFRRILSIEWGSWYPEHSRNDYA